MPDVDVLAAGVGDEAEAAILVVPLDLADGHRGHLSLCSLCAVCATSRMRRGGIWAAFRLFDAHNPRTVKQPIIADGRKTPEDHGSIT